MDYITPFYSQNHTEDDLVKRIDSLLGSHKDLKAYIFPVYIAPQYWDSLKAGRGHPKLLSKGRFKLLSESEGVCLFEFSFRIRKQTERITEKVFIVGNKEYANVYTIIALGGSGSFSKRVLSYFKHVNILSGFRSGVAEAKSFGELCVCG